MEGSKIQALHFGSITTVIFREGLEEQVLSKYWYFQNWLDPIVKLTPDHKSSLLLAEQIKG